MSSNVWRDSDPSDEEGSNQAATKKRSSRACDQCRKTKSKCERSPTDSDICKNCASSGNVCTYLGPSYKRGPPKGYIHAIEQRWQSIESLLGAILASPDPGVQDLLAGLRQDDLAREILNRVDSGPFGPSGRLNQPVGATKEDMFAQIFKSNESASNRDAARQRRQSRISREVVSSGQDNIPLTVPTLEWQDRISKMIHMPSTTVDESTLPSQPSTFGLNGAPLHQRRRTGDKSFQPEWNNMYTMSPPSDSEDVSNSEDAAEGVGQLSLDENSEIRYHGKSSGLHLLSRSDRSDERNEGGIWRLPMARVWPQAVNCQTYFLQEEDIAVEMPDFAEQERLINLYFTYVHPAFPVVHKDQFMAQFNARKEGVAYAGSPREVSSTPSPPRSDLPPPVSKLLVLSMLAIGARYTTKNVEPIPPNRKMWEGGCKYLNTAREVLNKVVHQSKPSTCQALLILGHREFGIGSMEQGWIYFGVAIRMAIDLGLNRNADKWQYRGADLFSPEDKQMRKQVWYGCIMADEYSSVYMGRPVTIGESDYDTLQPDAEQAEETLPWKPASCDPVQFAVGPSRVISCFQAASSLSIIVASIVSKIYPVKCHGGSPRSKRLEDLESRLDQWYIQLPDPLRYDAATKRVIPPPHVLLLHIKYWSAVLLLHRAFLPNLKGERKAHISTESQTISLKAFDLCQTAASHVSSIATVYHEHYNLARASPFLNAYLHNAGITHVVTLTVRPLNQQASLGLRKCLTALKEMEVIWPSARRAWDLLEGAKVQFDNAAPMLQGDDRRKRHAEDAFGLDKTSDLLSHNVFGPGSPDKESSPDQVGIPDMNTRIMAQMLGLDIPGIEPSTSYLPGYEWWPRSQDTLSSPQDLTPTTSSGTPLFCDGPVTYNSQPSLEEWLQGGGQVINGGQAFPTGYNPDYAFDFSGLPSNFGL